MDPPQNIIYFNSYSILVINSKGKMRRIYTPFKVQCIEPVDDIKINSQLFVDEVFEDEAEILLFRINGSQYAYRNFEIKILF